MKISLSKSKVVIYFTCRLQDVLQQRKDNSWHTWHDIKQLVAITTVGTNRNNAWIPRLFLHVNAILMKFFFFLRTGSALTASGCGRLSLLLSADPFNKWGGSEQRRLSVQLQCFFVRSSRQEGGRTTAAEKSAARIWVYPITSSCVRVSFHTGW